MALTTRYGWEKMRKAPRQLRAGSAFSLVLSRILISKNRTSRILIEAPFHSINKSWRNVQIEFRRGPEWFEWSGVTCIRELLSRGIHSSLAVSRTHKIKIVAIAVQWIILLQADLFFIDNYNEWDEFNSGFRLPYAMVIMIPHGKQPQEFGWVHECKYSY